jgi:hypothetical protein
MTGPVRRDARWTPDEDDLLRKLARSGESVVNISERLNRSPGSIRKRSLRLNIALAKSRRLKDDLTGKLPA